MRDNIYDELGRQIDALLSEAQTGKATFRTMAEAAELDPATDFRGQCLRGVDLLDEDLTGFDFTDADLTGADLRRAIVTGVSFEGANLTGAIGLERVQP